MTSTAHSFITQDDDILQCLTCGGLFGVDGFDDIFDGRGNPAHGSWACTGNTDQRHGDPVEHGDDADDPRYEGCECLLCV